MSPLPPLRPAPASQTFAGRTNCAEQLRVRDYHPVTSTDAVQHKKRCDDCKVGGTGRLGIQAQETLLGRDAVCTAGMPQDTKTVSAKLEADSTLATEFEEYRDANGMTSKSEAVRHLLRAGLEQETPKQADDDAADSTASGQSSGGSANDADISINLIRGNEPFLLGLTFVLGSESFLGVSESVAGDFWGSLLFAVIGVLIFASMLPMFFRSMGPLFSGAGDTDEAESNASGAQG